MATIARYQKEGGTAWVPMKFGGIGSIPAGRESLIVGVHKPNTPGNTGPFSVTSWTNQEATSGFHINITSAGTYTGIRFWGQIRVNVPGVIFRECQFHGPDPLLFSAGDPGVFRCYGSSINGNDQDPFEVYDSLIDPMPWVTERGRPGLSPAITGMHGYNFQVYRSEFRNVHDGINWVGCNGVAGGTTVADQDSLSQQNWYHKGHYANNYYGPSDGQVHSDGIQTNYGKNLTSRGDYIGGARDTTGYWTWPTGGLAPFVGQGYNSGDDYFGAGFMLKQEVNNDATHLIENVTIEDGWLEGCEHGINHASNSNAPNTWSSLIVRRMTFVDRTGPGASSWGVAYRGSGPDTPTTQWKSGPGTYIIRANTMATGGYSLNVIESSGASVPIANGGP